MKDAIYEMKGETLIKMLLIKGSTEGKMLFIKDSENFNKKEVYLRENTNLGQATLPYDATGACTCVLGYLHSIYVLCILVHYASY